MGWNKGYSIFEQTVIGAYNLGKLDKELLTVLMEPYRDTDIDSGGKSGLTTYNDMEVEEVVIKTFGGKLPEKPNFEECDDEEAEDYFETIGRKFNKITRKFGW